ncbi:MAG: tryptophan synthase subunit alpha [Bacteroidales bacterium]
MNKIDKYLQKQKKNLLSLYFTAGFPLLDDTIKILSSIQKYGGDMVEIGIPYSDPMADGPVIQNSNTISLQNGMNLNLLFKQLQKFNNSYSIPLLLMGYLNPVLQFGMEKFCRKCKETGIDGVILPDMPLKVYQEEYETLFKQYNLYNIFLVSPATSEKRLKKILNASQGFVYLVSSSTTTGNQVNVQRHLEYVDKIKTIKPEIPVLMGFGIDNQAKFLQICEKANGGIIGSAFIEKISEKGNIENHIRQFIQTIKPS